MDTSASKARWIANTPRRPSCPARSHDARRPRAPAFQSWHASLRVVTRPQSLDQQPTSKA
eukprot:6195739-Pleurochrysis_carterae.AAC.2